MSTLVGVSFTASYHALSDTKLWVYYRLTCDIFNFPEAILKCKLKPRQCLFHEVIIDEKGFDE